MSENAQNEPQKPSKGKKPEFLTPEYIEKMRKIREERKEKKRQAANQDKVVDPKLEFIKRPMLDIPGQQACGGLEIKVMSYNVLAQALIRRKLFPTSGGALKWGPRSQVLVAEFAYYDADIVCLQELDFIQYNSFWKSEFRKRGYLSQYYRSDTKNHGIAIFYKDSMFKFKHSLFINYDKVKTGDIKPSTITRNVGLMVYLTFTDSVLEKHTNLSCEGLIIGTTHMFWHPFGTAERTRQTYIVLQQMKEFTKTLNLLYGAEKKFYRLFAGDFNSQPFDSPYLSVTAKPIAYTDRAKNVLGRSLAHKWVKSEEDKDEDDENTKEDDSPVPESFTFSPEISEKIQALQNLHNELDMRAISLYSLGYHLVHKENAGIDNERNEPFFSNWAHTWRGLLDYIFVIADWDQKQSFSNNIDSLEQLQKENNIKLLSLLRLPTPEEMGPEPSGQPRTGQYPSDHLCIIAKIELS